VIEPDPRCEYGHDPVENDCSSGLQGKL